MTYIGSYRHNRSLRQNVVYDWVKRVFGAIALDPKERLQRMFEEAVELAQTELTAEELHHIVDVMMQRPVGDPAQEVAGLQLTILAYCAVQGIDADSAEFDEVVRVTSLPDDHFRNRQREKAALGISAYTDDVDKSA